MKHLIHPAVAALLVLSTGSAYAQTFVPVGPSDAGGKTGLAASIDDLRTTSLGHQMVAAEIKSLGSPSTEQVAFPECKPGPGLADIEGVYQMRRTLLSSSAALKLGIPVANINLSGSQMVLVQDYSRTRECLSTDNKTRLVYGQSIRTVISLADFNAKADATLAVVAANATISGKSNAVEIQVLGFDNPGIPALLAKVAGKELNVETYAEVAAIQGELMKLADASSTKKSVKRLGVVTDVDDRVQSHVAAVYALKQLKAGKTCSEAKSKYTQVAGANAIEETYVFAMGACSVSTPSKEQRDLAGKYLGIL